MICTDPLQQPAAVGLGRMNLALYAMALALGASCTMAAGEYCQRKGKRAHRLKCRRFGAVNLELGLALRLPHGRTRCGTAPSSSATDQCRAFMLQMCAQSTWSSRAIPYTAFSRSSTF